MDKLNRLSSEDRANIVAYLDGELGEQETRRLEALLANNPVARTDVELLAKTYELLDQLPRPKVSAQFTEKTVATARIEEFHVPLSKRAWFQQTLRTGKLAVWTLLLAASGAAGYALTFLWLPRESDQLLDNYPVIRRLGDYREAGQMEFLDVLAADEDLVWQLKREAGR